MLRVDIRSKGAFFVMLPIQIRGKKQADLVKLCGVKHAADQAKGVKMQIRSRNLCSVCQLLAAGHGADIGQKISAAAVCSSVDPVRIPMVF